MRPTSVCNTTIHSVIQAPDLPSPIPHIQSINKSWQINCQSIYQTFLLLSTYTPPHMSAHHHLFSWMVEVASYNPVSTWQLEYLFRPLIGSCHSLTGLRCSAMSWTLLFISLSGPLCSFRFCQHIKLLLAFYTVCAPWMFALPSPSFYGWFLIFQTSVFTLQCSVLYLLFICFLAYLYFFGATILFPFPILGLPLVFAIFGI